MQDETQTDQTQPAPDSTPTPEGIVTADKPIVIQPTSEFTQTAEAHPPVQTQQIQPLPQYPTSGPTMSSTVGMVNGQAFTPAPISASQFTQETAKKPSKWRYLFIVLGILQALGVALFFAIMASIGGQTGSEFIALLLFVTLVPGLAILALINLIGLPIYMAKQKPKGKGLVFSIISLVISVVLFLYGAYTVYQFQVAARHASTLSLQTQQKIQEKQLQYTLDNVKPEITKDEAIQLLQSCSLKGFYYTAQTTRDGGNWGELSTTGVVLTKVDGVPYRISIADRLIPELVPIAREAQKTCNGQPQFWHDGNYEN